MTDTQAQTRDKAMLIAAEPQLFVSDIAASLEYYTTRLGFAVAFSYGEPPFCGQVFRDGARLNLRYLDTPAFDAARRDSIGTGRSTKSIPTLERFYGPSTPTAS